MIVRAILIVYSNSRETLCNNIVEEIRLLFNSVSNAVEPDTTSEQRDMFYHVIGVVSPFVDAVHSALASYHEDCPSRVSSRAFTAIYSSADSSKAYGLSSSVVEFAEIDISNFESMTEQELLYSPLWSQKGHDSQYVGFKGNLMSLKIDDDQYTERNYLIDVINEFYEKATNGSLDEGFLAHSMKKFNRYIENDGIPKKYFISHASEDKDGFVRPLVEKMRAQGVLVWYDEYSLKIGESLTESIDRGIRECDYGVVVLSHNFFKKNWTNLEYNSLNTRDVSQRGGVILPIWHGVCSDDIAKYNLSLADKMALNSSGDLDVLVKKLIA